MIGKTVKVIVDRPLGSYHPKHKDMYYPINYGYVEGIIAPDGEEQDAYILGITEPVKEFTGKVIAIIHRYDDVEEKWVVATENKIFTKEEIKEKVRFQEQYFDSEIRMKNDIHIFGASGSGTTMRVQFYNSIADSLLKFAVVISKFNGKWVYCKHKERDTYEIPGGRRESGEAILETAKRELYEETGAVKYKIEPIGVYSVTGKNRANESGEENFGMLYYAEIEEFENEIHSEIEKIEFFDEMPKELTYPLIQPLLMEHYFKKGGR